MARVKQYHEKLTLKRRANGIAYYLDFKEEQGGRRMVHVSQPLCRCKIVQGRWEGTKCKHWRAAQDALKSRHAGGDIPPKQTAQSPTLTIKEAVNWWTIEIAHKAAKTKKSYVYTLGQLMEWGQVTNLADLGRDEIAKFRTWLERERSEVLGNGTTRFLTRNQQTVNVHMRNLRAFLNACVEGGRLASCPFTRAFNRKIFHRLRNRENFLTAEEVTRLLTHDGMAKDCYATDLFRLYYYTGMRLGELTHLLLNSVTATHFLIRKHECPDGRAAGRPVVWTPKHGVEREIPISPELGRLVERLRARSAKLNSPYLFCSDNGGMLGERNVLRSIKALYKACHCEGTRPGESLNVHTIRHTFASRLVNDLHTPLPVAMEILGHRNLSTTQKYLHTTRHAAVQAIARL